MILCLVGSEMCIRDRCPVSAHWCQRSVPGVSTLVSALCARCQRSVPSVSALCPVSALCALCPVSALCARCQRSGVSALSPVSALWCQRSVPGVSALCPVSAPCARCQHSVARSRNRVVSQSRRPPFPWQLSGIFDRKLQSADSVTGQSCHKYQFCRDKSMLVAANVLSQQKCACREKQKQRLSRQTLLLASKHFCHDKLTFVATKVYFSRQTNTCGH